MQTNSNVFFLTMIVGLLMISGVSNIKMKFYSGFIDVRNCGSISVDKKIIKVECLQTRYYTHKESFNIIDRCFEVYDDGSLGPLEKGNADASGRCNLNVSYNSDLFRTEVKGSCKAQVAKL